MVSDYGIAASEYWKMTPSEVSIIIEAKRPKTVGLLDEDDYDRLTERREKLESEGVKVL